MLRIVAISGLVALSVTGAVAKTPTHKTMAAPHPAARASCLDSSGMVSHVAFQVADNQDGQPDKLQSCSQLLSTDTLLSVRRWNRT